MFFDDATDDPDAYRWAIKNTVVPRPIAWISTASAGGLPNLAPFSFFNLVTLTPRPILQVCFSERRDTLDNLLETGEFVVNLAADGLIDQVSLTAVPVASDVDEAELAGLAFTSSTHVSVPRVSEAPVSLECRLHSTIDVEGTAMVFGLIVGIHLREGVLTDTGRPDYPSYRPVGRMGGSGYAVVDSSVNVPIPRLDQV